MHRSSAAVGFMVIGLALAVPAGAQTPAVAPAAATPTTVPFPSLSKTTKTSSSPNQAEITAFIQAGITNLLSSSPSTQTVGREGLIDAVADHSDSAAFENAYTQALAKAIKPVLANKSIRTRLNAGIVVARVAKKVDNAYLADLALQMLQDPSDAIALWGMKTTTELLPHLATAHSNSPLLKGAITETITRHPAAPIVQEAYTALSVGYATPGGIAVDAPALGLIVDQIHSAMATRLQQYAHGIPPQPLLEKLPVVFLTLDKVWKIQTPQQQLRTVQLLSDLLQLDANHIAGSAAIDREGLAMMIQQTARALIVVGMNTDNAGLREAAAPLARINAASKSAIIQKDASGVFAELKKAYPSLQPVQKTASTAPASTASAR